MKNIIEYSDLDGKNIKILVGAAKPHVLTLDYPIRRLYFAQYPKLFISFDIESENVS